MADQGDRDFLVVEDVWGVANKDKPKKKKKEDSGKTTMRVYKDSSASVSYIPASARKIPKANESLSPSSSSSSSSSSAPIDIPDWSKIYGKNKGSRGGCGYKDHGNDGVDEDDDDDDGDMIPPHEWLARKLARSQISSFSMCEGLGRTLKGRDLSKVRNAILTKTGFIE